MIRNALGISILSAALVWFGQAAADTGFRSSVTLSGGELKVSDIFVNAGTDAVIGTAPAPGRRLVFDRYALQRIARQHNLKWQPRNPFVQTVVTRESRMMEMAEIEDALWRALTANNMPTDRKVELTNKGVSVYVASNLATPFRVENPVYDARNGRATGVLAVATDGEELVRYRLDAVTYTVVEVPVLARRIRRGETVEAGDVRWKKYRKDAVGRNTIQSREAVIGQAARRFLSPGQALMLGDLEAPKIVRKGNVVTVYFETGSLRLTAKARATEDGALNDTIRVVNIRSNKSIEAVVRGATKLVIPNESFASN